MHVLAQAHLTYLVCERADRLVLVDQHAAHERVLFERYLQAYRDGRIERQEMLFPLAIDLAPDHLEALLAHRSEIEKLGIDFELLGPNCLGVRTIPVGIKEVPPWSAGFTSFLKSCSKTEVVMPFSENFITGWRPWLVIRRSELDRP